MTKVCRTCTQALDREYFYLNGSIFASAHLQVKDILYSCIPELDLDLVPNSAVCKNCLSALCILYQFKIETLNNESVFRGKQCVRVKNFQALTKNLSDSEGLLTNVDYSIVDNVDIGYEVELDDVNQLKTEIVYADLDETKAATSDDFEEVIEIAVEEDYSANEGEEEDDPPSTSENVKIFDYASSSTDTSSAVVFENNCQGEKLQVTQEVDKGEKSTASDVKKEESKVHVGQFIQCVSNKKMRRNVKRPYVCTECDFRTDAKASLTMHKRIHTGEKPFHCQKCPYRAKRKAHLDDHMKLHTGERPFKCSVCDKSFITKQILKKHVAVHTGEKPYRCVQCNFRSRYKLSIANHIQKEHMKMPSNRKAQRVVCYICGKCLSGPASLSTHMKIHTGIKSHLCELCGKYFREKGMLKNHMQIHTGEKPFTCTECNYSATRKAHLQDHMRTHNSQQNLVKCIECDKCYTTKILLRKHVKSEHENNEKDESSNFYDLL